MKLILTQFTKYTFTNFV